MYVGVWPVSWPWVIVPALTGVPTGGSVPYSTVPRLDSVLLALLLLLLLLPHAARAGTSAAKLAQAAIRRARRNLPADARGRQWRRRTGRNQFSCGSPQSEGERVHSASERDHVKRGPRVTWSRRCLAKRLNRFDLTGP